MGISNILELGRQGMAASRQSLQVTSNNIANANTPGYSRQKVVLETNDQIMTKGLRLGGGVRVKEALRIHDQFVEKQILQEARGLGGAKSRSGALTRLQDILGNDSSRVGEIINNFFGSVRELTANPEQAAMKVAVVESAKNAAHGFKELHASLDSLKQDLDNQLEVEVSRVNTLARELAGLNENISKCVKVGSPPNELYDKRDLILRELSQKLGLQAMTDDNDQKIITLEGVGLLVNGSEANELMLMRTPGEGKKDPGSVDIFMKAGDNHRKVSQVLKEGELAGILQVRDEVVSPSISFLDRSVYEFAKSINDVHRKAGGLDGAPGTNFFKEPVNVDDASYYIDVEESIVKDPTSLKAGLDSTLPGDNRLALSMADIQNEKLLPGSFSAGLDGNKSQTLNEGLNNLIAEVGVRAAHEERELSQQESIMEQLNNYRESVSGVSLEEEAMNMMQYQTLYNASAKALKTGLELFDTILSLVD